MAPPFAKPHDAGRAVSVSVNWPPVATIALAVAEQFAPSLTVTVNVSACRLEIVAERLPLLQV